MSQEQIIDALEFIDDDIIESVNVLRKYPERHKHLWLNYVAVAACVVLAIFGGFKYLGNKIFCFNGTNLFTPFTMPRIFIQIRCKESFYKCFGSNKI